MIKVFLFLVFGLSIWVCSLTHANGLKSNDYYGAVLGHFIQPGLHGQNVDTDEVLKNEVLGSIFSFIRFQIDDLQKSLLINEQKSYTSRTLK